MQDHPDNIAGFDLYDLKETAAENFDVGSDSEVPALVRFRMGVTKVLLKRRNRADAMNDPRSHAVFLLGKPLDSSDLKREPFWDDGSTALVGQLWFVNEAAHSAFGTKLPDMSDASDLVAYVVETLGCGNLPALVLNVAAEPVETRFYPSGLSNIEDVECALLETQEANEEAVCIVAERTYRSGMITPDVQNDPHKVWSNAATWTPIKHAEDTIGGHLAAALQGHYYTHRIRRERNVDEGGRLDISIVRPDYALRINRVEIVLELKVLRSVWSSGNPVSRKVTRDHVESGVEQAFDYRDKEFAETGALYCFDMRRDAEVDDCFEHVKAKATELDVVLRYWRLYNSTAAARAAGVLQRLGSP